MSYVHHCDVKTFTEQFLLHYNQNETYSVFRSMALNLLVHSLLTLNLLTFQEEQLILTCSEKTRRAGMGIIAAAKKAHMLLSEARRMLRPVLLSTMPVCSCSHTFCFVSELDIHNEPKLLFYSVMCATHLH
jgi:hypothetical protein